MKDKRDKFYIYTINLIIIILLAIDIYLDLKKGYLHNAMWPEYIIISLFVLNFLFLLFRYFFMVKENKVITQDLSCTKIELERFRRETKDLTLGLSAKIEEQLDLWRLSKAEKEVALLLLKGLGQREIAEIRKTAEKTIRQQATSIYQKSHLTGRHELSAFFLEDLLVIHHFNHSLT